MAYYQPSYLEIVGFAVIAHISQLVRCRLFDVHRHSWFAGYFFDKSVTLQKKALLFVVNVLLFFLVILLGFAVIGRTPYSWSCTIRNWCV